MFCLNVSLAIYCMFQLDIGLSMATNVRFSLSEVQVNTFLTLYEEFSGGRLAKMVREGNASTNMLRKGLWSSFAAECNEILGTSWTKQQYIDYNQRRQRADKQVLRADAQAAAAAKRYRNTTGGGPPGPSAAPLDPDALNDNLSRYSGVLPIRDELSTVTNSRGETVRANAYHSESESENEYCEDAGRVLQQVSQHSWHGNTLRVSAPATSMVRPPVVNRSDVFRPGGPPVSVTTDNGEQVTVIVSNNDSEDLPDPLDVSQDSRLTITPPPHSPPLVETQRPIVNAGAAAAMVPPRNTGGRVQARAGGGPERQRGQQAVTAGRRRHRTTPQER